MQLKIISYIVLYLFVRSPKANKDITTIAKFLLRSRKDNFIDVNLVDVEKVLNHMCMTQATLKSMDGASHHLYSSFKKVSSLTARYKNFISNDHKNTKEANKLLEYVTTVERTMQATEILQACATLDSSLRAKRLKESGLTEVEKYTCDANNLKCVCYVMRPISTPDQAVSSLKRFFNNEIIIGVVREGSVSNLLRTLEEEPETMELGCSGLVQEEVTLQPTLFSLASSCLQGLTNFLLSETASKSSTESEEDPQSHQNVTATGQPLPSRVRVLGHSTGGGVAALLVSLLEGSLNTTSCAELSPFIGQYRGRVSGVCLGPPPCMSRAVVCRAISSVVCGDDIIPRASHATLASLRERVVRNSGRGVAGWMHMDWLGDAASIAVRGVQQYASGRHDLTSLQLPGRVFFIKNRKLQKGATIQRVLRGNWKEDLLWTLHEVLVSERMLEHHTLEAHVRTLARC